jgi:hypothetical protein
MICRLRRRRPRGLFDHPQRPVDSRRSRSIHLRADNFHRLSHNSDHARGCLKKRMFRFSLPRQHGLIVRPTYLDWGKHVKSVVKLHEFS